MPASTLWLSEAPVTSLRAMDTLPAVGFAHARQTFGQLALTIARYAGKPHDLSGMDLQVDPAQRLGPAVAHGVQSLDLEPHFPGIQGPGFQFFKLAANHHLHQFSPRHLAGEARADHLAIAQNGHAVADRHDLVQLM